MTIEPENAYIFRYCRAVVQVVRSSPPCLNVTMRTDAPCKRSCPAEAHQTEPRRDSRLVSDGQPHEDSKALGDDVPSSSRYDDAHPVDADACVHDESGRPRGGGQHTGGHRCCAAGIGGGEEDDLSPRKGGAPSSVGRMKEQLQEELHLHLNRVVRGDPGQARASK